MRNRWVTGMLLMLAGCSNNNNNTVTDIDGNVYRTVTIGNQVWMAENLKVTRYRNGDTIAHVQGDTAWRVATTGAWCHYNNDTGTVVHYGLLYNWHAVNDSRQIAPEGWHVPGEEELAHLVNWLGGDTIAGGKMKAGHWLGADIAGANQSGFTALPGGYRFGNDGTYHTRGSNGYWWSATRSYEMYAWSSRLYVGFADVKRDRHYENYGLSVRCVKDRSE